MEVFGSPTRRQCSFVIGNRRGNGRSRRNHVNRKSAVHPDFPHQVGRLSVASGLGEEDRVIAS